MNIFAGPDSVDKGSATANGVNLLSVSNRELSDRAALCSFCTTGGDHRNIQNQSQVVLLPTGTIKHHERSTLIYSKFRGID